MPSRTTLRSMTSGHEGVHRRANFPDDLDLGSKGGVDPSDVAEYGIAAATWDAAVALVDYLSPLPSSVLEYSPRSPVSAACTICDLGSGNCFLPLTLLARLCPGSVPVRIFATDLPDVLPLMTRRVGRVDGIVPLALEWGDVSAARALRRRGIDVVVCSDLVFLPELFTPLLTTLLVLTDPYDGERTPEVVFGYKQRVEVKESPFFATLGRFFDLDHVCSRRKPTADDPDPPWRRHRPVPLMFVFVARRRKTPIDLESPGSLLSSDRVDDQWETMLLMDAMQEGPD